MRMDGTLLIGNRCVRQKSQPEQRDAFCFTESLLINEDTNSEAIAVSSVELSQNRRTGKISNSSSLYHSYTRCIIGSIDLQRDFTSCILHVHIKRESEMWGRTGFDGVVETWKAGRGFSLASLKNEKCK